MASRDLLSEVRDFTPGLNLHASPSNTHLGETDLARDVEFLLDGSAKLRPPLVTATDTSILPARADAIIEKCLLLETFTVVLGSLVSPHDHGPEPTVVPVVMLGTNRRTATRLLNADTAPTLSARATFTQNVSDAAAVDGPVVSVAEAAGNIYVAYETGRVARWSWRSADAALREAVILRPPTRPRTYRIATLGDPDRADRDPITTDASWSENLLNPFSDVQAAAVFDAHGNTDPANPGRFPPSHVLTVVNAGSTQYMFSAMGSQVRWSHPLAWIDSGYYGYAPPLNPDTNPMSVASGDPGPDWPTDAANHRNEPSAQLRLFGPEDWQRNAYTDIAPEDGDRITAMVHWLDSLLVFKERSMWQLIGNIPDQMFVLPISRRAGCISEKAVVSTPYGVFFLSTPEGLHRWDEQTGIELVSVKLGSVAFGSDVRDVALGYSDHRLLLTTPLARDPDRVTTFVLDLRHGGWTEWTIPAQAYASYPSTRSASAANKADVLVATAENGNIAAPSIARFETDIAAGTAAADRTGDTVTAPATVTPYTADLRVGQARDGENPDMLARWRRQRVEVEAIAGPATVTVEQEFVDASSDRQPPPQTFTVAANRRQSLETSLGARSRAMSLRLHWNSLTTRVTGVLFSHWPGRSRAR